MASSGSLGRMLTSTAGTAFDFAHHAKFLSSIEGHMPDLHGYLLLLLAQEKGLPHGHVVEIGSFKGKSTCWLALGSRYSGRHEYVYAVDHFQGSVEHAQGNSAEDATLRSEGTTLSAFKRNVKKAGVEHRVKVLDTTSADAADAWSVHNQPVRLLFIDGDHSYEGVWNDFKAWAKYVAVGGVIAFHDVDEADGVTEFYRDLVSTPLFKNGYEEVIHYHGLNVIMKTKGSAA